MRADVRFEGDGLGTVRVWIAVHDIDVPSVVATLSWHRHQLGETETRTVWLTPDRPVTLHHLEDVRTQDRCDVRFEPCLPCTSTASGPRGTRMMKEPGVVSFLDFLDPA